MGGRMAESSEMMKPRLIYWDGLWRCGILRGPKWQAVGRGWSPQDAYADWKAKWEAATAATA